VPAVLDAGLQLPAGGGVRESIVLVGFMGAGKSTIGRMLARRLGRCFVETDDVIAATAGCTIPEIFRRDGEARFRALEAEVLAQLSEKCGDVVATGGGMPCAEGRMEALRALGTVVWLRSPFDEMYARAGRARTRPMLENRTRAEVEALYRERERYYALAQHTVDTGGLSVDQAVARVLSELRRAQGAGI
jgi:shikimate kinase